MDDQIYASRGRGVEHSREGITDCHSRNSKLFQWTESTVAVKRICKQKKNDTYTLKSLRLRKGCWWKRGTISDWRKVSWVSSLAWSMSRVSPHWWVVIQRNTQPVDDNIYIYTQDLMLNNPQVLICHKTPINQLVKVFTDKLFPYK